MARPFRNGQVKVEFDAPNEGASKGCPEGNGEVERGPDPMANERRGLLRYIRKLAGAPAADAVSDRELLEDFARRREQDAFSLLVERHGPMVLGVCRRVLGNVQDAEDAFQATFTVLARQAPAAFRQESVGSWLYAVAYRLALKAKAAAQRRRMREREVAAMKPVEVNDAGFGPELRSVLDSELELLPEKYRVPLVLCYLEGKSKEETARQLGWTMGTVRGRLERGRDRLRERLTRRGCALTAGSFAAVLAAEPLSAAVPPALAKATVKAATLSVARTAAAASGVPGQVVPLTNGATHALFSAKLKIIAATVLLTAGMAGGVTGGVLNEMLREKEKPAANVASEVRQSPEASKDAEPPQPWAENHAGEKEQLGKDAAKDQTAVQNQPDENGAKDQAKPDGAKDQTAARNQPDDHSAKDQAKPGNDTVREKTAARNNSDDNRARDLKKPLRAVTIGFTFGPQTPDLNQARTVEDLFRDLGIVPPSDVVIPVPSSGVMVPVPRPGVRVPVSQSSDISSPSQEMKSRYPYLREKGER